jgi:hypothetical protein
MRILIIIIVVVVVVVVVVSSTVRPVESCFCYYKTESFHHFHLPNNSFSLVDILRCFFFLDSCESLSCERLLTNCFCVAL